MARDVAGVRVGDLFGPEPARWACAATPHVCLRAALHTTHRLVLANDRVRIYAR
jgi:hypothetical protein